MLLSEYTKRCLETAIYPNIGSNRHYPFTGLVEEMGECAGHLKRRDRDDGGVLTPERKVQLGAEIGDTLWYFAMLVHECGLTLNAICGGAPELSLSEYQRLVVDRVYADTHSADLNQQTAFRSLVRAVGAVERVTVTLGDAGFRLRQTFGALAVFADAHGFNLDDVAAANVAKIADRKNRGVLQGSGSHR